MYGFRVRFTSIADAVDGRGDVTYHSEMNGVPRPAKEASIVEGTPTD